MTGYETNLIKLIAFSLEKHTTELKNLNTNIQNLNTNIENINTSLQAVANEFNTFNAHFYNCITKDEHGYVWFRVWLP